MVDVKEDMTGWKMWEHGVPDSRWIVVKQVDDYIEGKAGNHRAQWLCECSCEEHTQKNVIGRNLQSGISKSCGCLRKIAARNNGKETKKYNDYKLNLEDEYGLYGIGYCTNTNNEFYFDMDDYEMIQQYCWIEHIIDNYHVLEAKIPDEKQLIRMQWLVAGKYYDHIDRNPLNNRKYNLRVANESENAQNRTKQRNNVSGFVGVYWKKKLNKWAVQININKKQTHLGYFINKKDAIITRLRAEKEYYGEFAPQRHLFKEYGIEDEFLEEV